MRALLALVLVGPALAVGATAELAGELKACASMGDNVQRLGCYDALAKKVLAATAQSEQPRKTRDDTYCLDLFLNGDPRLDSFCVFVTGDRTAAQARIVVGVGNAVGRQDQATLEGLTLGPYDIVSLDKTDLNGDGRKDVVLRYGPLDGRPAKKVVYLSKGDGTLLRQ